MITNSLELTHEANPMGLCRDVSTIATSPVSQRCETKIYIASCISNKNNRSEEKRFLTPV